MHMPQEIYKMNIINKNKNASYQNMQEAANTVLRGKFIALNVPIRDEKRSQVDSQISSLRNQRKKRKLNSNQERTIINIKVDIHKIGGREAHKLDKTKSWIFEKSNKTCMSPVQVYVYVQTYQIVYIEYVQCFGILPLSQ